MRVGTGEKPIMSYLPKLHHACVIRAVHVEAVGIRETATMPRDTRLCRRRT